MTQVPVAEGIFTWPSESPQLIGARCEDCGIVTFPSQGSCPRCASTSMAQRLLPRRGKLWAWTIQGFPPPSPPYDGVGGKDFVAFGIGFVELAGEVKVESRLTVADPDQLQIGMEMDLVVLPYRIGDDGEDVMTFAFAPVS